jgi:hypothetical protein
LEYINTEETHVPSVGEVVIPGLFGVVLSVASLQAMNYQRRLTVSKNTIRWSVDVIWWNIEEWILRKEGHEEAGKDGWRVEKNNEVNKCNYMGVKERLWDLEKIIGNRMRIWILKILWDNILNGRKAIWLWEAALRKLKKSWTVRDLHAYGRINRNVILAEWIRNEEWM